MLDDLNDMAERTGCLIIGVKHINKKPDLTSDQKISGASAFVDCRDLG